MDSETNIRTGLLQPWRTSPAKIVVLSTFGTGLGLNTVPVATFGAFVLPLSQEFGWSRGNIAFAITIFQICNILVAPIAGWLIDRVGARRVLLPSILLFGAALMSLSLMSGAIWQLYAGYSIVSIFGIGTASPTYAKLIVSWFKERRALALGFALTGVGIGMSVLPILVQSVIDGWGWRPAFVTVGLVVIAGTFPATMLWAWDSPTAPATRRETSAPAAATDASFAHAARSKAFFLLLAGFVLLGAVSGSLTSHMIPILAERGIEPSHGAVLAAALGVAGIFGRVIVGYLLDRIFAPALLVFLIVSAFAGMLLLIHQQGAWLLLGIVILGFTTGGEGDFMPYLTSRYIGMRAFSRVLGFLYSSFVAGIGLGTVLMGYSENTTGSYGMALNVLAAIILAAVIPFLFLGRYPSDPGAEATRTPDRTATPAAL